MSAPRRYDLVLALYPNTRGFAFVVFEGSLAPVDWSVKEIRGLQKNSRCLLAIEALLGRYTPDVVVLQDTSIDGTRRAKRVCELNASIEELVIERGISIQAYSRAQVRETFSRFGVASKYSIAESIAKHVPAFERYLPPPRKLWMSEDARMCLFDAAALAMTFFQTPDA